MADLTFLQLNENPGTLGPSTLVNAGNAAADLVCDLYEKYPTGILPSIGRTPISDLTDGLLRELCGPRGKLPPDRTVPFSGGQCNCVSYNVEYNFTTATGSTGTSGTTINGPIASVKVAFTGTTGSGTPGYGIVTTGRNSACDGTRTATDLAGSAIGLRINSVTITRSDGNPDLCGNPAPQYDDNPDGANYTISPTININGGPITVPVTLAPTFFTPVNIFRPELNVDVGGINVKFDLGGVSFSPSINPTTNITLPSSNPLNPLPPARPGNQRDCPDVDISELIDRFDDVDSQLDVIQECACEPEKVILTTSYAAADSRTISLPPDCIGVRLTISTVGPRVRSQYGNGGGPDVYFIGWASFGNGAPGGERIPISYLSNFFFAPENATQFSYTTTYNSTASLIVLYKAVP